MNCFQLGGRLVVSFITITGHIIIIIVDIFAATYADTASDTKIYFWGLTYLHV